jgi:hypothetical protein
LRSLFPSPTTTCQKAFKSSSVLDTFSFLFARDDLTTEPSAPWQHATHAPPKKEKQPTQAHSHRPMHDPSAKRLGMDYCRACLKLDWRKTRKTCKAVAKSLLLRRHLEWSLALRAAVAGHLRACASQLAQGQPFHAKQKPLSSQAPPYSMVQRRQRQSNKAPYLQPRKTFWAMAMPNLPLR